MQNEIKVHIEGLSTADKWHRYTSDMTIALVCKTWKLNWSEVVDAIAQKGVYEFKRDRVSYRVIRSKKGKMK
jgi:hypothetical protein